MIEISWLAVADMLEHAAQLSDAMRGPAALDPIEQARLKAEQTGLIKGVAMIVAGRYRSPLYERTFYHVRDMLDEGRDVADVALSLFAGLEDKVRNDNGVRNGTPTYIEEN